MTSTRTARVKAASAKGKRRGKVTLADVAQHAGVDRSVVSRVLSGDPRLNIRQETRDRVVAAIRKLDYRPNAIARSLRTARTGVLGLVIPDFANPVYAFIIKGAEAEAMASGLLLLTASSAEFEPSGARYLDLASEGRVDGLLLAGGRGSGEVVAKLEELGTPWIMVNRRTKGSRRYVILDDERAASLAVEHLVQLGHRRIAHISGPAYADTAERRRAGYQAAVRHTGLRVERRLVVRADYTNEGGAAAMEDLLALPEPPTAVFVANVASAIGALHAAGRAGLSVPRDLSVVAVHDLPLAGYLDPPLTTVRMPLEDLGRRAVGLLTKTPAGRAVTEVVESPMELVVRASTAPPRNRRQ